MYFPVGWPKYLSVGQGKKSKLKCVVCNRYRMLFALLTETTISIWHCKPCVEIVCYQRCHSSIVAVGTNELAEWRQDSSMLAITTTDGYVLFYQLEQDIKGDKGLSLYEYHQTKTNQNDANEAVPALRLTFKANVNYKVSITSLSSVHDDLLVTLQDGRLDIVSWDEPTTNRKAIGLCDILFSVDMQLAGLHLRAKHVYPLQAIYSPFLEGFAVVLSDGRGALVAVAKSEQSNIENDHLNHSNYIEWNTKGIWAPGLNQATCVAINNKYRLIGFGTKRGECCVYAIDDVSGCLVLSHTIALSQTHYPNIRDSMGSVLKIDWSPDGCALALSWTKGGLSIWSVFGACLMCSLASDRAYASDGTPHVQGIFKAMCWGVEGYHLWLISDLPPPPSSSSGKKTDDDCEEDAPHERVPDVQILPVDKSKKRFRRPHKKSVSDGGVKADDLGQLLQIQFAKSALAVNPCMSNHCHVLMHSEDRLYVSCGEREMKSLLVPSSERQNNFQKAVTNSQLNAIGDQGASTIGHNKGGLSPRRKSMPASLSPKHDLPNNRDEKLSPISEEGVPEEAPIEPYECSAVGNKQWTVIPFPLNYLPSNWPIRFTAVDKSCCYLAIAGNFGLAHYTVISRKWKVFGNVAQEKEMVVTGGLTWWEDFLVVACFNLPENQDELRVYPRLTNLDNAFACIRRVRSQILLINTFQNLIVLFTYDCRISIYVITRDDKVRRPAVALKWLQDISMARFVPYPTLVASVTMTALHMETATRRSSSSTSFSSRPARETEVIIVNVAGRLLLLQRSMEEDEPLGEDLEDEFINPVEEERKEMRFTSPVVLASCVENIWTCHHKNKAKVHLTDALWLGCGGAGVRVWLPLFPPRQNRHSSADGNNPRGFELQLLTARRITLAFSLDTCYPLAVLFNEAVILGVTSEMLLYQGLQYKSDDRRSFRLSFPFSTIERTCEIYLHQILRQLLRRNLGYHALQVAATCKNLSCFAHVLELMLHEVLEEEATASEPIPDPLLPTVIKFLEEFPEYLQTVVHCARKTEIALWEYLFNSVGSPRDLFEECLATNQLQTAASYLIILQNLEQLAVARQDATRLFDQALQNHMWELANDIARFLRAIGDGDASGTPRHPTLLNTNIYPAVAPASLHNTPTETEIAFNKFASTKTQGNTLSSDDFTPLPSNPGRRMPPTRSYTESFLLPATSASVATATGQSSVTSSLANSFVSRYSVRQYHQEHPVHRPLQHSVSHPVGSASNRPRRLSGDRDGTNSREQAATECAEHYFIDVILSRQARKMLGNRQLRKLGTFAAYVDFQLVPWLMKERNRAAKVDDPITCLKDLHDDFDWPYPTLCPKSNRFSNGIFGSPSHSISCDNLQSLQKSASPMQLSSSTNFSSLTFSGTPNSPGSGSPVRPGLSRRVYMFPGNYTDDDNGSGVLTMLSAKETASNLTVDTLASDVSEGTTSYMFEESSIAATSEDVHGFMPSGFDLDDRRGHPRSEMQLQYLLELFLQAVCLDWAALICLMLKDSSYMARLVHSCRIRTGVHGAVGEEAVSLDTLQRTRDCLQQVDQWSVTECSGYKAVLVSNSSHVRELYSVINAHEIAHAEKQAMLARQQRSASTGSSHTFTGTASHANINNVELPPRVTITSTITSAVVQNTAQASSAKKHIPIPGSAVAQVNCNAVNGELSSSTDSESAMNNPKQTSSNSRPKTLRTRRNSDSSCIKERALPLLETTHTRTPSSPAKINFANASPSDDQLPDGQCDHAVKKIGSEGKYFADAERSSSRVSDPDFSENDVSASDEEDNSACVVS